MTLAIIDPVPPGVTPPRPLVVVDNGENTGDARRQAEIATSAAAVALAAGGIDEYADTAAGLAGTSVGETFWVDLGDGTGQIYRHDSGPAATALRRFIIDPTQPGAAEVIGTQRAGAFGILKMLNRRLDAQPITIFDGYDEATVGTGNDDSVAMQAFVDFLGGNVGQKHGMLPGTEDGYAVAGINVPAFVKLASGAPGFGYRPGVVDRSRATLRAADNVTMFTLGDLAGLHGFDWEGTGSASEDNRAVEVTGDYTTIDGHHFNDFGGEAVWTQGAAAIISNVFTTNMLMKRNRADRTGIFRLEGTDTMIHGYIELNVSLTALYSTDLYLGGIYAPFGVGLFSNHDIAGNVNCAFGEWGLWIEDTRTRVRGGRMDLNFGPGGVGSGQISNLYCLNNSRAGDGLYSGWETRGHAGLTMSGLSVSSNIAARHDYGLDLDYINVDDFQMGTIDEGSLAVVGAKTGRIKLPAFAFSGGHMPAITWRMRDGTTAQRPTDVIPFMPYFDRTLGHVIWRNGDNTAWIDATGASV